MKLKLFEYVILLHPEEKKKDETEGKTILLQEKQSILAKDEKEVGTRAARAIAEEYLDHLDRVEILIRPF